MHRRALLRSLAAGPVAVAAEYAAGGASAQSACSVEIVDVEATVINECRHRKRFEGHVVYRPDGCDGPLTFEYRQHGEVLGSVEDEPVKALETVDVYPRPSELEPGEPLDLVVRDADGAVLERESAPVDDYRSGPADVAFYGGGPSRRVVRPGESVDVGVSVQNPGGQTEGELRVYANGDLVASEEQFVQSNHDCGHLEFGLVTSTSFSNHGVYLLRVELVERGTDATLAETWVGPLVVATPTAFSAMALGGVGLGGAALVQHRRAASEPAPDDD